MAFGSRADVRRAIEAAGKAMPAWMKLTAYDRAKVLKKTADLMRERADSIAKTLTMEQGKPLAEAKAEIMHSADTFEWFAEEGKRAYGQVIPNSAPGKRHVTLKHPVGVVGAISPWNFPITLQSRKIAPALAAGCTIVCKPATQTPLSLVQVFECMIDAGLPAGVANLVMGPAPLLPAINCAQKAAISFPRGVMAPMPVTTTLFIIYFFGSNYFLSTQINQSGSFSTQVAGLVPRSFRN